MLKISLLGSLQVSNDQVLVDGLHGRRTRSILAYLLLNAGSEVSRSELAGNLWPEIAESQARTNLRRELHALKRTHSVIDVCITSSKNTISWHMPPDCSYDVDEFTALCDGFDAAVDNTEKIRVGLCASALYQGQLAPGVQDDWIHSRRAALHQQWTLLSDQLLEELQLAGKTEKVVDIASKQLTFDPYLESAYAALIEAHIASGNSAMALHAYHRCASILEDDLNTMPNERIQTLYAGLIENTHSPSAGIPNLITTTQKSDFIGRSDVLHELINKLQLPPTKLASLVVISGESGIGKTRLADEVMSSERLNSLMKVRAACRPARIDDAFGPFKDWMTDPVFKKWMYDHSRIWVC